MLTIFKHNYPSVLFNEPPHSDVKLMVIVPVKNEEDGLLLTLDALRFQVDDNGDKLDESFYEVLLLVNNSIDQTYHLATQYQRRFPEFKLHVAEIELHKTDAHVGMVRRLLMDEAYERFMSINRPDGIIVSTDGDSQVDQHWVHYILKEISQGNDVVGGRILPRDTPKLSKIHHLRDVSYRYHLSRLESILDPCSADPWPRHFQCYGPSLAVTCAIYDKAGRIPPIPYLEDEEFRKALYRIDAKVRKSPKVKVYTSARLAGKVEFGFSVQLQQWGNMTLENQQQHVEPLNALIEKTSLKSELRRIWRSRYDDADHRLQLLNVSKKLLLDDAWLTGKFYACQYFGELWELVEAELEQGNWRKQNVLQPISEVIKTFRKYFSELPIAS